MDFIKVDLNEYDLSYEIQFVSLMIVLLEPYIRFDWKNGIPMIYKKGGGIRLLIEEGISLKEYVYFIQHTFPDIINNEIKSIKDQFIDERIKHHIFEYSFLGPYHDKVVRGLKPSDKLILPSQYHDCSDKSIISKCDGYYEIFKQMSQEEVEEQKRYYNIRQSLIENHIDTKKTFLQDINILESNIIYLKEIKRINKRNGKIKDVLQFLDNLQYIY